MLARVSPVRARGILRAEAEMFIIAFVALLGTAGVLLWFTGWAESRVIDPEANPLPAKDR